jgi:hypothetical protein
MAMAAALPPICPAWAGDLVRGSAQALGQAVPGHPALTWRSALKLLLPDVHAGSDGSIEASELASARRIDGEDKVAADGAFHATWLSARDVVEGGRRRLLIFAEVDQSLSGTPGSAMLALIDPAPQPRLLDLVDIGNDRENYLESGAPLEIGRGSDLVFVSSAHLDAGEDHLIRQALFVDHDRFGLVASVFLQSLRICGYERTQTADFAVQPQRGAEFGSLQVAVTEHASRTAEECDPAPRQAAGVKAWRATFRWDRAKRMFTTTSHELDALARHNDEGP